jgi:hypothetical protein
MTTLRRLYWKTESETSRYFSLLSSIEFTRRLASYRTACCCSGERLVQEKGSLVLARRQDGDMLIAPNKSLRHLKICPETI